jgi:D-3-phosphoglycerate dehydrogenase / 2-oxoglutarate reductase
MRILVTAPYPANKLEELENWFGTVLYQPWIERGNAYNAEELKELLKQTEADAIIAELDELSQDVIDSWSPKPKFVAVCRATPSQIDLKSLKENSIPLFTAPARNIQAVTELIIGNIISIYRHVHRSEKWIKDGNWTDWLYPYKEFRGQELFGKKIGIVGLGAVGQSLAKLLEAFSCEISYYDPFVSPADFPNYTAQSLEDIFSKSDIISLHLPSLPKTKGMISAELLNLMRKDTLFINTSRSSVVDTPALIEILEQQKIYGAILDVFDSEPPGEQEMRLIQLENVLATPHIAGSTEEVVRNQANIINAALAEWNKSKGEKTKVEVLR